MQAEEFKEIGLEHRMLEDCWLEGLLQIEEKKESEVEHEYMAAGGELAKKPIGRGKGRPKGEKNFKNTEKKLKDTIGQENLKTGHWSVEENKRYHWFLEIHHHHFICKEMRRLDKIFKTMAIFIGTREAEQCRSHHQKMEKKHHTFANILLYLRKTHYATEDAYSVEEDMRFNEIQITHFPLSVDEIKSLENGENKKEGFAKQHLEERHIDDHFEMEKQMSFNNNRPLVEELFGERYEQNLDLEGLLF